MVAPLPATQSAGVPTPPRGRDLDAWAVAALALLVYLGGLRNGFVFDDRPAIVQNPFVTGPVSLAAIFAHDFWGRSVAGPHPVMGVYRPLVDLTFALDWHLGSGQPWVFHLTSALLHAAATAAFYRVLCARLGNRRAALAAGALFAVHPLHTEAVAGIVGRADVMAFLAAMGLLAVHRRPGARAALAAPALFLTALLCKESSVLLVPLLVLHDLLAARTSGVTPGATDVRRAAARYGPYLAAVAVVAWARLRVVGSLQGYTIGSRINPLLGVPFLTREVTALRLFGKAIGLLVVPVNLLPDYGRAVTVPSARPDAWFALGAVAVVGLGALGLRSLRRDPARAEAVAWLLVPGLFAVNAVFVFSTVFAERLWYLPSAGACLLAGSAIGWLAARRALAGALLGVGLVALYAPITVARTAEWASNEALFAPAVAAEPRSAIGQNNLGEVRFRQGRYGEAFAHCDAAVRLAPGWGDPLSCRGALYDLADRPAEAERDFRAMLATADLAPESMLNYVRFLGRHGRHGEALALLRSMRRRGIETPAAPELEAVEAAGATR